MKAISFNRIMWGEFVKSQHLHVLLTFSLPTIIVGCAFLLSLNRLNNQASSIGEVLNDHCYWLSATFYLAYIIITAWLINHTEHRVQGFKHLFTLPIPRGFIYLSKLLLLITWFIISLVVLGVLTWLAGQLLTQIYPELPLLWDARQFVSFLVKLLVSSLTVLSAQFALSIHFRHYLIPLGVGSFMVVIGFILSIPENGYKIPYAYSFYFLQEVDDRFFTPGLVWSFSYSLLFLMIGYLVIHRKDIK